MREIPELYALAMEICHEEGIDYYDPRTGKCYPAPKTEKPEGEPPPQLGEQPQ